MSQAIERLNACLEGRYELQRELGRGGMAIVYLARDLRHSRPVAVKVMDAAVSAEIGSRRFATEVRTTARLNHPHIMPLFDSGEAEGQLFYVMPVAEGESLEERLAREGRIPAHEAVRITSAAARALAHAHERGVVHRDVKPGNILLHQGECVVADFGISLALGADTRLTDDGLALGTPHYMSPEQVGGEDEPDGRSDQYSLACVLFEMLEGNPPFGGRTPRGVLTAHLVEDLPTMASREPSARRLEPVIRRAVTKDPGGRFPTLVEFADALAEALAESGRTSAGEAAASDSGERSGSTASVPGLVVLPFDNLSPDPDNEYFSDGLTEEVITGLSRLRELRVISRTSAMRLKSTELDVPAIARELGVQYVLEGGVRKARDDLRITARLIDARTDANLWSERFMGTVGDVFRIQEEVAHAIVNALQVRMSPAEAAALAQRPIDDPRAYESYLRARYEAWRFSADGLARATRYINAALEIVGDNELLLGTLGHITAMHVESGVDTDPGTLGRLRRLVSRIFALNPESSRGHWIEAFLAFQQGDMASAIVSGERARTTDPDDPDPLLLLTYVYANVGRMAEANRLIEKALVLDPLTPVTALLPGFVAVLEGRYADAIQPYRRAWEMDPESSFTAVFYGWALAYAKRLDEAVPFLDQTADRIGAGPFAAWARSLARALEDDPHGVAEAITPEFEAAGRRSQTFARAVSDAWALVGDADRALTWLGRAVDLGLINEPFLTRHAWFLDRVRDDPRFEDILERVRRRFVALP